MLKNSVNHSPGGAVASSTIVRVGQLLVLCRMAHRRPAVRACLVGAGIAIGGALLGGCNITSFGESGQAEPDATDRVRATDLQPRFPRPAEGADTGSSPGPRSSSFFGSGTALAPTAAREPTPGSAGE